MINYSALVSYNEYLQAIYRKMKTSVISPIHINQDPVDLISSFRNRNRPPLVNELNDKWKSLEGKFVTVTSNSSKELDKDLADMTS